MPDSFVQLAEVPQQRRVRQHGPEPCCIYDTIEGSLELKLPTVWTDGKAEVGRVREEKSRREKIREEKESDERRCRCAKR